MPFIKLDRKFFESQFWTQERTFSQAEAWLDLIQLSRFEADSTTKILSNGRQITVKQGEIHASLRYLSVRWKWSVGKTKRFIDFQIQKQEIEHRTEQGESLLKVLNKGGSQKNEPQKETPNDTATEHRRNTDGTNNKNVKNNNLYIHKESMSKLSFVQIKNLSETLSTFTGNKGYLFIAYRFWELWKKRSPNNLTVKNAKTEKWYKAIEKMIKLNVSIDRIIAVYVYFSFCLEEREGYDNFWFKTLGSVTGLMNKNKEDVYHLDRIVMLAEDKLNADKDFENTFNTFLNNYNKKYAKS